MKRTLAQSVALTLLVIPTVAISQSRDTTTLNPVVVSATKSPVAKTALTQAVTIFSGDELRAKGITRVSDALRSVPGISVVQNGAIGSVTSVFLRGGESRYTRVMIDGVTVNSPGGFFDFSHLTTDNVERIEVVRGPASVVYGADAVSGIVRIFTKQGKGPLSFTADARGGTYNTREGSVSTDASAGPARFSLGAGLHATDGILPFNNEYYNGTLSGSAGIGSTEGSDASVTARYTNAEFHYPTDFTGAPVDSNSYRVQHRLTVGGDLTAKLSASVKARLLAGTNEVSDLTEDIAVPFGSSSREHSASLSRNKRRSAEAGLVFKLPPAATLNVGGEYVKEREASTNSAGPVGGKDVPTSTFDADRNNKAVYAELMGSTKAGESYSLAVRRDDNSAYDAFNTYRIGTSLPLGGGSRLRASLSTAFNAPAFNQLRPTLYTSGNPNLKPERSRSWEVGAEESLVDGVITFSANYFNQRFSDLIQYVAGGPPNFLGSYDNLTEARSNGYEVELTLALLGNLSGSANFTHATPEVTKVSDAYAGDLVKGQALLRRPRDSGTGSITWSSTRSGSLSVIATYVGERPDVDFNEFPSPTVTLPAYTKLDAALTRELFGSTRGKRSLALTVRVDNLLDRKYEDVLHYQAPRRTYLIGARLSGSL